MFFNLREVPIALRLDKATLFLSPHARVRRPQRVVGHGLRGRALTDEVAGGRRRFRVEHGRLEVVAQLLQDEVARLRGPGHGRLDEAHLERPVVVVLVLGRRGAQLLQEGLETLAWGRGKGTRGALTKGHPNKI